MEQKKILWIIASVGVFLLVVMGAALIINRPAQAVEPAIASLQSPNDTWSMPPATTASVEATADEDVFETQGQLEENVVSTDGSQTEDGLQPQGELQSPGDVQVQNGATVPEVSADAAKVDTITVYSGTTNVYGDSGTTTIDLNSIKRAVQEASVVATNQAGANAVAAAKPVTPPVEHTPARPTSSKPVAEKVASNKTAEVRVAPVKTDISKSVPAKTTSVNTTPAKTTPARTTSNKLVDQYWVQVASVTNKKNADNARTALAENKIESEIFTHTAADGNTYYRLRVGPYTTKTEAEYWKGRIVLIEEFSDTESYITNTTAKK